MAYGRIKPRTVKGGKGSYEFTVEHKFRDPLTGTPTPKILKRIGTLRPKEYSDREACIAFIERLQQATYKLIWDEVISVAEGKAVMNKFRDADIDGISLADRATP